MGPTDSLFATDMEKGAVITGDGLYRYSLSRVWDRSLSPVNFVMLNPSVASATVDDPTVRRCIGFARSWGHGAIVVTNLFAYRATDPKELRKARDPIGPDWEYHVEFAARNAELVVAAWGNHGSYRDRSAFVRRQFREWSIPLHVLKLSRTFEPAHPLYLPGDLRPALNRTWAGYYQTEVQS